jgi:acyl carrier protein
METMRFNKAQPNQGLHMPQTASSATSGPSSPVYLKLTEILQDVFDDDKIKAKPELDAAQVEGWDSMGNVRLFLAIEQEFGVRFNASEISAVKNLGELVALLDEKQRS